MPISYESLTAVEPRDFVLLPEGATVADARDALPADAGRRQWMYVVVPSGGGYTIARWWELEAIALLTGWNIARTPIARLDTIAARPGYTPPADVPAPKKLPSLDRLLSFLTPAAPLDEQTTATRRAQQTRDAHPGRRAAVTRAGRVVRLLAVELLAAGAPAPGELQVIDAQAEPPPILGEGTPQPAPPADERVINCWIERPNAPEGVAQEVPPGTPLLAGESYELLLDVNLPRVGAQAGGGDIGSLAGEAAAEGRKTFDLRVELVADSRVFTVYDGSERTLIVPVEPRPSRNRALFTIEPSGIVRNSELRLNCYAFGRIVWQFRLRLRVTRDAEEANQAAPPAEDEPPQQGRGVSVAEVAERSVRDERRAAAGGTVRTPMTITVTPITSGPLGEQAVLDYQITVVSTGATSATLQLAPQKVDEILKNLRARLSAIVDWKDGSEWPYRARTSIPKSVHEQVRVELAKTGRWLFESLFFHDRSRAEAQDLGDLLERLSQGTLDIDVVAERFPVPWTLIYPRADTAAPQEDEFWGFKHTISYLPQFATWRDRSDASFSSVIPAGDTLPLGFVFDTKVVREPKFVPLIEQHRDAVKALAHAAVSEVLTPQELIALLKNPDAPPLLYVYTHASNAQTGEQVAGSETLGSDAGYLSIDGTRVTLGQLRSEAGARAPKFAQAPLVFVNACQGAERDAIQTEGLVSYLFARGARGVIATEVDTPALFAAEFAETFLKRFVAGEAPAGELLLALRRAYLKDKRNVMGLVYGLHASGDLRVARS